MPYLIGLVCPPVGHLRLLPFKDLALHLAQALPRIFELRNINELILSDILKERKSERKILQEPLRRRKSKARGRILGQLEEQKGCGRKS